MSDISNPPQAGVQRVKRFYKPAALRALVSLDMTNQNRNRPIRRGETKQEVAQEAAVSWQQTGALRKHIIIHARSGLLANEDPHLH